MDETSTGDDPSPPDGTSSLSRAELQRRCDALRLRRRPAFGRVARDFATLMAHVLVRRARNADADGDKDDIHLVAVPRNAVRASLSQPPPRRAARSHSNDSAAAAPQPPPPDDPEESVRCSGDATLHRALVEWRKLSTIPFVAGQHGPVQLPFERDLPALPDDHVLIPSNATSLLIGDTIPSSIEDRAFIARKTADEVITGGIEPVSRWDMVSVILPAFVAVHPGTGKRRIIFDGRALNAYLRDAAGHVKYESVRDVLTIAGSAATKLDLASAFRHVQVHDDHKPLLGFVVEGRLYRYRCLPFGLSWSPGLYLHLLRPVIDKIRQQHAVRLVWYVDDFILIADSVDLLDDALTRVLQELAAHGWRAAADKTYCTAYRVLPFLGLLVDLRPRHTTLRIPRSKADRVADIIKDILQDGHATATVLQHLAGKLSFLSIVAPELRLYRRPIDTAIASVARGSLQTRIPITPSSALADHLAALFSIAGRLSGLSCTADLADGRVTRSVYSDASATGWGVLLIASDGSTIRPPADITFDSPDNDLPRGFTAGGKFTDAECADSSAAREIRAIAYGIVALDLKDAVLNWHSDATAAVGAIRRWASPSPGVLAALTELFTATRARNISLSVTHVFRDASLMPVADWLSRVGWRDRQAEWCFSRADFRAVQTELDVVFTADLFATGANTQVPRAFCSRFLADDHSRGDAFYAPWTGEIWWAFPPVSLRRRIVNRLLWYDDVFSSLSLSPSSSSPAADPSFSIALTLPPVRPSDPDAEDWRRICSRRRSRHLLLWSSPNRPTRRGSRHRCLLPALRLVDNRRQPAPGPPPWTLEVSLFHFRPSSNNP